MGGGLGLLVVGGGLGLLVVVGGGALGGGDELTQVLAHPS